MKKVIFSLILILGIGILSPLQSQTDTITLTANPPKGVDALYASIVGNQGNSTYYYWIVAKYPIGNSKPFGPTIVRNAPTTLTLTNYIKVSWSVAVGATTYDILRTTTANLPTLCIGCAVGVGVTTNTLNDTGIVGANYTLSSVSSATGTIRLDNSTVTTPTFILDRPLTAPGLSGGGGGTLSLDANNNLAIVPCPIGTINSICIKEVVADIYKSTSVNPTVYQYISGVAPLSIDVGRTHGTGIDETGQFYILTKQPDNSVVKSFVSPPVFTGDSGAGGIAGIVPAPAAGDAAAGKYLHANGNFEAIVPTVPACIDTSGQGWFMPLGRDPVTAMAFGPNMGGAMGAGTWQFIVPCKITFSKALFNVKTLQGAVCGGGADPCGLVFAVYAMDRSLVAASETMYTDAVPATRDIKTTGAKVATWASPVTLQPGVYWFSIASDGTALRLAGDALAYGLVANADGETRIGYRGTMVTGSGNTLTANGTMTLAVTVKTDNYSALPSIYLVR